MREIYDGLLRLHILPRRDVHDGDRVLPLGDPTFFQQTLSSLEAWLAQAQPNVLREHDLDGRSFGTVRQVEADEDGIHVLATVHPDLMREYQEGKLRYVSPRIAWNFAADDYDPQRNNLWPAALLEVSLVSVPRFLIYQVPITDAAPYVESVMSQKVHPMSEHAAPEETPEETTMTEEMKTLVTTMVEEAVATLLATRESEMAEDGEESEESGDEMVGEDALERIANLTAEVARLKAERDELHAEIAKRDAELEVESAMAETPHLSTMREDLVALRLQSKDRFESLFTKLKASAPAQSRMSGVRGGGAPHRSVDALSQAYDVATKEGISYRDALAKLS
jgi:uncharacterized small protein (DUF1192 family)